MCIRDRVSASLLFRAEATRLPWAQIGYRALRTDQHVDVKWADEMKRRTAGRDQDVHVWWACAAALGVPRGPFTVWVGNPSTKRVKEVPVTTVPHAAGLAMTWGGAEAAHILVAVSYTHMTLPTSDLV